MSVDPQWTRRWTVGRNPPATRHVGPTKGPLVATGRRCATVFARCTRGRPTPNLFHCACNVSPPPPRAHVEVGSSVRATTLVGNICHARQGQASGILAASRPESTDITANGSVAQCRHARACVGGADQPRRFQRTTVPLLPKLHLSEAKPRAVIVEFRLFSRCGVRRFDDALGKTEHNTVTQRPLVSNSSSQY